MNSDVKILWDGAYCSLPIYPLIHIRLHPSTSIAITAGMTYLALESRPYDRANGLNSFEVARRLINLVCYDLLVLPKIFHKHIFSSWKTTYMHV